jgi:hypothetical protein
MMIRATRFVEHFTGGAEQCARLRTRDEQTRKINEHKNQRQQSFHTRVAYRDRPHSCLQKKKKKKKKTNKKKKKKKKKNNSV